MKIIDIFSGVGGLSQGFISKGFNVEFAIEYDKDIAYSYSQNHSYTKVYNKDITQMNFNDLKSKYDDIDVIVGGPPCQGFSQKGKRLSIFDNRNFLFQRFIDIVKVFRPKYFVLENVPNILTTENGFFKCEIEKGFEQLGYSVSSSILNAADFGIPQNRRRAFFIGFLGDSHVEFPQPNFIKTNIKDAIYDLPFIQSGEGDFFSEYTIEPFSSYQKLLRNNSKGIYNHISTNHSKLALERLALIPKGKGREVLPAEHRTKSIYSGTWCRLNEDGIASTITTRFDTPSSGLFTHPVLNRCLTVREAARIQSFSDSFIFYGNKSSQMKQVGNAVPPLLAAQIAQAILSHERYTLKVKNRSSKNEFAT